MKYNFDRIDTRKTHVIFIDAIHKSSAFNRRVMGVQWGHSSEQYSTFTTRVDYVLTEAELQILALVKILDLIEEFIKTPNPNQSFIIFFKDDEALEFLSHDKLRSIFIEKLATDCQIKLAFFERLGHEIELRSSLASHTLTHALKLALYEYKLRNDFQNETLYLSSVSSKVFDNLVFDVVGEKLIQYISPTEYGIIAVPKRLITPEDEEEMNNLVLKVFTVSSFSQKNEKKFSEIRRSCLVVRDSDLMLMVAPLYGGESIENIEAVIYATAKHFNIPIFILDSETLTWFTKSKTDKRDLVKAKHLPKFKTYLNIGLYCSPNLSEKTWETFKKVFKN